MTRHGGACSSSDSASSPRAAVLPAAVASLNGGRFQSECEKLAHRSRQMVGQPGAIEARAQQLMAPPASAGSPRIAEALDLAEDVARITIDEVAEWSVLYAKDIVEP